MVGCSMPQAGSERVNATLVKNALFDHKGLEVTHISYAFDYSWQALSWEPTIAKQHSVDFSCVNVLAGSCQTLSMAITQLVIVQAESFIDNLI